MNPQDLAFLWQQRAKNPGTANTVKRWAKRISQLPGLVRLVAKSAWFRLKGASLGKLVVVGGAITNGDLSFLRIGDGSVLGRCLIHLHAPLTIGIGVAINDGVTILTASHDIAGREWITTVRPVCIGDYAWIATGAMILPGVAIGKGAIVGAGAVVDKNVADYTVVTGNRAVLVGTRPHVAFSYTPSDRTAVVEAWLGRRHA